MSDIRFKLRECLVFRTERFCLAFRVNLAVSRLDTDYFLSLLNIPSLLVLTIAYKFVIVALCISRAAVRFLVSTER
jgi:hypothetical protein